MASKDFIEIYDDIDEGPPKVKTDETSWEPRKTPIDDLITDMNIDNIIRRSMIESDDSPSAYFRDRCFIDVNLKLPTKVDEGILYKVGAALGLDLKKSRCKECSSTNLLQSAIAILTLALLVILTYTIFFSATLDIHVIRPTRADEYSICSIFNPFANGSDLNMYLYKHGMNFSLHGWWPNHKGPYYHAYLDSDFRNCDTYSQFSYKFGRDLISDYMINSKNGTLDCCRFQYHEYMKHGCLMGYNFDQWVAGNMVCITKYSKEWFHFNISHAYYCHNDKLNHYLQSANSTSPCVGCKPGYGSTRYPICSK